MKCSIITPTNLKNSFLEELYQSLVNQTFPDWEWILFLNGESSEEKIPFYFSKDSRVKIYKSQEDSKNIGFIKNKAFSLGTGDILVELDHDDILLPNCLEKLVNAFQDKEVGFVYSNTAMYHHKNEFIPFNPTIGWTHSKIKWNGKELYEMHTFKPTSHSLQYIWYAPDHVRAWRRTVYNEIGGHNQELFVCDDHELMIRTFLKTKMLHIPEALYIYRITGENNWCQRNAEIQKKTVELGDQYIWDLAVREAKQKKLRIIDLNSRSGVKKDCEFIFAEQNKIPLDNNTVGVINLNHSLQLFNNPVAIMKEIHRVLCHGGWAFIEVPSTDGRGAWQDPSHVSFWNENSFKYYTEGAFARFINNDSIKFVENKKETIMTNDGVAITFVRLIALKDGNRFPGVINI